MAQTIPPDLPQEVTHELRSLGPPADPTHVSVHDTRKQQPLFLPVGRSIHAILVMHGATLGAVDVEWLAIGK